MYTYIRTKLSCILGCRLLERLNTYLSQFYLTESLCMTQNEKKSVLPYYIALTSTQSFCFSSKNSFSSLLAVDGMLSVTHRPEILITLCIRCDSAAYNKRAKAFPQLNDSRRRIRLTVGPSIIGSSPQPQSPRQETCVSFIPGHFYRMHFSLTLTVLQKLQRTLVRSFSSSAHDCSFLATGSANSSPNHSSEFRRRSDGSEQTSLGSISRRVSFQSSPVIQCRYSRCARVVSVSSPEAANFKNCHNCSYTYCSRACRRAHWEKHRKTCLFSRIGTLCRQVVI